MSSKAYTEISYGEAHPEEHLPENTQMHRPRHDVAGPDQTRGVGYNDDVTVATDPNRSGFGARDFDEFAQPRVGDVYIDRDASAPRATAGDTLGGATSRDVHDGLGHPGSGQTRAERDHDGQHHRKRNVIPLDAFGSGVVPRDESEIDRTGESTRWKDEERPTRSQE